MRTFLLKSNQHKSLISLLVLFTNAVFGQQLLDPLKQPQFVNPLPIPTTIDATAGGTFTFDISQFGQKLGLVDAVTKKPLITQVWGYNGTYPGPTVLAKKNVAIQVFWRNKLVDASNKPLPHLLPIDVTIDWALKGVSNWQQYGVPIVTHLHGGHTESASDGLPEAWYTPNFTKKGPDFIKGDVLPYTYSNTQEAATLWYHDHAMGITRLNAYAGLAGFYLITDDNETRLRNSGKLPAAPYDIGLAIQDKAFTADGQLYYDAEPDEPNDDSDPSIRPENFGDIILLNGMAWPVLNVEPRQYRFRLLNASDSRFYNLRLSSGQQMVQIASDDGLLPESMNTSDLLIAPGERKEIIIDFSSPALWGQTIIVRNIAKVPYPRGSTVNPLTTGRIMAFTVSKPLNTNFPLTTVPATLRPSIIKLNTTLAPRKLILYESEDEFGRLQPMLGTFDRGILPYSAPVTENPVQNTTEIWEIYNETMDAHPIHLHQVQMQLVSRQKFKAGIDPTTGKPANVRLIGTAKGPEADEAGWKDTYIMYPGEVTRVIAKFDLPGKYVWHCHILSHEDHEMMRPYYVEEAGNTIAKAGHKTPLENAEKGISISTFPNPFTSRMVLQVALDKPATIAINVYDEKGKLVQQVYGGMKPAGVQQFTIDGKQLAGGTYLCEIWVNNKRTTRKVIVQK